MSAIVIHKQAADTEYNKVPLFTIEETGEEFFTDDRPRTRVALKFSRMMAKGQQQEAVDYMMEQTLGAEAYDALLDCEYVTDEDLNAVIALAGELLMGKSKKEEA